MYSYQPYYTRLKTWSKEYKYNILLTDGFLESIHDTPAWQILGQKISLTDDLHIWWVYKTGHSDHICDVKQDLPRLIKTFGHVNNEL
jgi:hypothetical protein